MNSSRFVLFFDSQPLRRCIDNPELVGAVKSDSLGLALLPHVAEWEPTLKWQGDSSDTL